MHTVRTRSLSLVAVLAAATVACAPDSGTAPSALTAAGPALSLGAVGSVFNVQLRAFPNDPLFPTDPVIPTDPLYGYGHLQLRLGSVVDNSCLPPNPITPQPGTTLLSVCGRIFNEGGALYSGGGIYALNPFGEGPGLVAAFNGTIPTDPCRRYEVAGAVAVPDAIAADMVLNPTHYQVRMDGDVSGAPTRIGGLVDGSAWGPVGSRPETDPFFATKVCSVTITP